jgi:hypothetical protein
MIHCFFGFYRNADEFVKNINKNDTYIYCPNTKNENDTTEINSDTFKMFDNPKISLYSYNKQIHIEKSKKLNIPKFNEFYQQSYRIFSFFYNIKNVLQMIQGAKEEDWVLLSRIDIGLNIDYSKVNELKDDIIIGSMNGNGVDDKWFIFKYKHVNVFTSLYDAYETYLTDYYNGSSLATTRPEDVFKYHFLKHNMRIQPSDIVTYHFKHVCSEYCGHNGVHTKT